MNNFGLIYLLVSNKFEDNSFHVRNEQFPPRILFNPWSKSSGYDRLGRICLA